MKALITILRILANVAAAPVLVFFFYYMVKALGSKASGVGYALGFFYPFLLMLIPVALNLTAKALDNSRKK